MAALIRILAVLVGIAIGFGAETHAAAARPNVLFIQTDDQGPWALGLSGHPDARTPNLDRLFRSGAWLKKSFTVTPVCSPSRASLMTSRYGSELGITDWIDEKKEPDEGLDPATPTWSKSLHAAGYRLGLMGKWHLGVRDQFHPSVFGYDVFTGFRNGGSATKDVSLEFAIATDPSTWKTRPTQGFIVDVVTDAALRFLDESANQATSGVQPFCLSVHYREPHTPWVPAAEEDSKPFANLEPKPPVPSHPDLDLEKWKTSTRRYLASVASVDRNVGRLLDRLESLKLAGNTIVIFTSDHGYNVGHHGVLHKGNGVWLTNTFPPKTENVPADRRPNMLDTSLLLPTCIRWPGVVPPGTVIDRTVTQLDWFPTLLEATGTPAVQGLRGRSIVPLLKAQKVDWNDDLYAEYSPHNQLRADMRCLRSGGWKLMCNFLEPFRDELYHIAEDPLEEHNLMASDAAEAQAARKELRARILARMRELKDPVAAGLSESR
ncbi:MAG TPA: sulfatase-like hydrolase/transferase [Caulifigura sp.]|nr:sulfatase-like hydrolase/transferase [Caulifigura sp.]